VGGSQSPEPRYDELVTRGMGFVGALVGSQRNKALFQDVGTLASICQQIVVPNLLLRAADVEAFEDNPMEFLRRDIEGSDADTRRRCGCVCGADLGRG
jgi:exportin-2 (importin alpha re-exporter)